MYPMSFECRRFVEFGLIFVYWTLNLSLSSSRYCIVPAPGRHGADLSRSVSVSYYPCRNRIVGGDEDAGPGQGRQHGQVQEGRFQVRCCSWLHHILNGSWEVSATTGVFAGFGTAGLSPGRRL